MFYKRSPHPIISILFVITSQTLGYGIAGIMRKFLVWPASMIWPANLVNCALFRTLHNDPTEQRASLHTDRGASWTMSRLRFFFLASFCQFLWYWFPGYIFPVLSLFSWMCMLKPDNVIVSQLTGIYGLGMGSIELDWNAWVSFLGSPIIVPFWLVRVFNASWSVPKLVCLSLGRKSTSWSVLSSWHGSSHRWPIIRICGVPRPCRLSVIVSSRPMVISTMYRLCLLHNCVWTKQHTKLMVSLNMSRR